ncbi:SARP family transcriptional regulator [Paracoccus sp. Z330]|uniref:SARP family transcriptional regulator n=1 Tax=Paracoccus onchidii TaxID=3017813 RepID=A0ABT4ZGB9_9RHOB|nr:SARP family transcriptional regulator [Paracoccus onchidii]MDB6178142.1 SARP family transcriptional regulator [Paracoccus onchidii]
MSQLVLRLAGPVSLTGPENENLTPRGMKARGALAVIGSSTGMRIARPKLQDLLFSERDAEHGSASLRQLLREIRIALGPHRAAMITGPGWVGFDNALVRLDMAGHVGVDGRRAEFAADLDIADPEFEDWLRDARIHYEDQADQVLAETVTDDAVPTLIVQVPVTSDAQSAVASAMVLQEAASRVADMLPIQVLNGDPGIGRIAVGIELGAMASRMGNDIVLLFTARLRSDGRMLWTRRFALPSDDMNAALRRIAGGVAVAIMHGLEHLRDVVPDASVRRMPLQDVFSYSASRLSRADEQLSQIDPNGDRAVILALRSYIRHTMLLERLSRDPDADSELAAEMAGRARELSPGNPTALGVNAMVAAWKGQFETSFDMARHAIAIDDENPIARLAYSSALTSMGYHREAEAEASAAHLSALSELGPAAWVLRRAIAATRVGDLKSAERYFATTHGYAPQNRPALRFLSAIRYQLGDETGAIDALRKLKKLEPDFTLELMASDQYPVESLRRAGLLRVTKSGLI